MWTDPSLLYFQGLNCIFIHAYIFFSYCYFILFVNQLIFFYILVFYLNAGLADKPIMHCLYSSEMYDCII